MKQQVPVTIDEYISRCPVEIQPSLQTLRGTIRRAAPEATEKISWGMATFSYHGNLVHFSAEKKHIGFHPAPSAITAFADALSGYVCSKGTVQFPYAQPLPLALIEQMVRFRVAEQLQLAQEKKANPHRPRETCLPCALPQEVAQRLHSAGLGAAYDERPTYQRNGYIAWIMRAKRPETKEKRLLQMLEELRAGNGYMGIAYTLKKQKGANNTQ